MIVAQHNCSNQDDSGLGSRDLLSGINKWPLRGKKVKGKYSLRVSIQSTNTKFCKSDKILFSKTAHFCCNFINHIFSYLLFLSLSLFQYIQQRCSLLNNYLPPFLTWGIPLKQRIMGHASHSLLFCCRHEFDHVWNHKNL